MKRIIFTIILLAMGGCVSAPTQQWVNPEIVPSQQARMGMIDLAECDALAMRKVKLPELQYQPEPSPLAVSSHGSGPMNDFYKANALGRQTGSDIRGGRERRAALGMRKRLSGACMMRRGWMLSELSAHE